MHIYALKFELRPPTSTMKLDRHNAIRQLISAQLVPNQDELRRLLVTRGIAVTQATLSRDLHSLKLYKGPSGYQLPGLDDGDEEDLPSIEEVLRSFGLEVKQALNQLVLNTTVASAQPVAVAIDDEEWDEVVGTIAGDNTVLIICPDAKRATELRARLERMIG